MKLSPIEKKKIFLMDLLTVFLAIAITTSLYFILTILRGILIPFVMAGIIAYILYPIPNYLHINYKFPKWLAITIIYLICFSLILTFIIVQVPILIEQIQQIIVNIQSLSNKISNYPESINKFILKFGLEVDITPYTSYILEGLETLGQNSLTMVGNSLTGLISNALKVLLTIILSIYMLADADKIVNFFRNVLLKHHTVMFDKVTGVMHTVMRSYFKSMVLLGIIVGFLSGLSAYIFGMKYAFTIGGIIGVLDLIPIVGPLIGIAIAGIVALNQSVMVAILVVIACLLIQYLENQFFRPMIQGESVGVHPLVVFLSLFIGANLWGIIGMFLSIPIAGIVYKVLIESDGDLIDDEFTELDNKENNLQANTYETN